MKKSKPRGRLAGQSKRRPAVLLMLVGVSFLCGVAVAIRRRWRTAPAKEGEGEGKQVTSAIVTLLGHEFSFSGHTLCVLKSGRDAEDGSLRFDYSAPPRANVSEHVHRFQEERNEVVSGTLGMRVGGQELLLTPGQKAVGPPDVPHAWWNPSEKEEVRFVSEIRPGLEVETFFETLLGLSRDGKTIGPIPRNPLQLALLADEIASWLVLRPVEKVFFAPVAVLAFVGRLLGYRASYLMYSGPKGTGKSTPKQEVAVRKRMRRSGSLQRTQQRKAWTRRDLGWMTLREWLPIVAALLVPLVIALGIWGITWQLEKLENQRARQAQKIENQRAEADLELAEQRAQDEALQAYLDQMSQLILDRKLLEVEQGVRVHEPGDPVHTLAQARTSTAILTLDAEHNESVTHFLIDSGLAVRSEDSARLLRGSTLSHAKLGGAHLPNADLGDADLSDADLSNALLVNANLIGSDLSGADLSDALLDNADLVADLAHADLSGASLIGADLSDANLFSADLSDANLIGADLSRAVLDNANLSNAVLDNANLGGADGITNEELAQQAVSLEGADMPNGQKYEDWLKSEPRKEDGKTEGSS
jgi:mannose-6-phosphate isomerase-like protein (cupin superfamily)